MIGEHTEVVVVGHGLDATSDVAQRVDVEAAVDLVEDRELRLQHRELQRLQPLLLAPRELDVESAVEELLRDAESRRFDGDSRRQIVRNPTLTAERCVEEVAESHPGQLHRVLQCEEHAERGPLVGWAVRAAPPRRW